MNKTVKKAIKVVVAIPLIYVAGWAVLMVLYAAVLLAAGGIGVLYESVFGSEADRKVTAHVTIYVDPDVQRQGGVILVGGLPVTDAVWKEISTATGNSARQLAMLDPQNPKAQKVRPGDLHYGLVMTSKVAALEIQHPADGTYTYNFLPLPTLASLPSVPLQTGPHPSDGAPVALLAPLQTRALSSGSYGSLVDPETGGSVSWPSGGSVWIMGEKHNEEWARSADYHLGTSSAQDRSKLFRITKAAGVRLFELTPAGLEKHLNELK